MKTYLVQYSIGARKGTERRVAYSALEAKVDTYIANPGCVVGEARKILTTVILGGDCA